MNNRILILISLLAAAIATAQPTVDPGGVLNVASYTITSLPNSGIAQGSMFVIFGQNLGPRNLQGIQSLPLQISLAGTSVSITVNNKTLSAPLFYTSARVVAAVMPSNIPVGAGTLRVVYQGLVSAAASVNVVAHAPGILTLNAAGYGPAVLQNYTSNSLLVNTVIEAASPGQLEILWGTGLGPITGDDANYPPVGSLPFKVEVFVGGKTAKLFYAGRSGSYPGIDQIMFYVPDGVAGCQIPVYVKVEGVLSNYATMSVASQGSVCADWHGFSAADMQTMAGNPESRIGSILLGQTRTALASPAGTITSLSEDLSGQFYRRSNYQTLFEMGPREAGVMLGSCVAFGMKAQGSIQWTPNDPSSLQSLDAGTTLQLTGPNGQAQVSQTNAGKYSGPLPGPSQAECMVPGQYNVNNGAGGADIGPFQATLTIPSPITWTGADTIKDVTRTQPLTITWTGGDASKEFIVIAGASVDQATQAMGSFVCAERVDSGKFTVPADVLSALPAASAWSTDGYPMGTLSVGVMPILSAVRFSAPGLDAGYFSYARQLMKNVGYK